MSDLTEIRLTEAEWRTREDLRLYWDAFCDADPVPEDFIDRMENAGLVRLRRVTRDDLQSSFASDRGIHPGGQIWALTPLGQEVLAASPPTATQDPDHG